MDYSQLKQNTETPIPIWSGVSENIEFTKVQVDGAELACYSVGQGVPVVCMHAIGHSAEDYQSVLCDPPAGFRMIAVDFPGHGSSSALAGGQVSSAIYAELIAGLIRKSALTRPILVGNSIGGATALRLAARPEVAARGLVLSNPGGIDNRKVPGDLVLALMVQFFQAGVRRRWWFPTAFRLYYRLVLSSRNAHHRRHAIVREGPALAPLLAAAWQSFRSPAEDLRNLISRVQCPVLITWAMYDRFLQYGRNIVALRKFRAARLLRYKIGHTPSVEDPETFSRDLAEFLGSCLKATGGGANLKLETRRTS